MIDPEVNKISFWIPFFLGSGLISALVTFTLNWLHTNAKDQKDREIKFLDEQIRKLYGPLYCFVSQNHKLLEIHNKLNDIYTKEFCNQDVDSDFHSEAAEKTIQAMNRYIAHVKENNTKIKEIFDMNYSLIDPEDLNTFFLFFEDHARLNIERLQDTKLSIPFTVYSRMGSIYILKQEFIDEITKKFIKKQQRLNHLIHKA